jgi:lysophospholipase L1-like esterase
LKNSKVLLYLKNNFWSFTLIFLLIWMIILALSISLRSRQLLILFSILPLVLELSIRLILFTNFGTNYKNSILFYSLVSDKALGYRFRKNIFTSEQPSQIFDQFLNRWNFERTSAKNSRLINFHTDKLGFRGEGFNPKNKENKMRIFCCGGSTTACNSVDDEDTWPSILQHKLRERGFDVEVINAGVPGWYSFQDLELIRNEIIYYQPDLVLVHQGWNEEFEFSSLNLGKWWKPKSVRNEIEENFLYLPRNKFLSQRYSLLLLLIIRSLSWNFIFKPNMNFLNVKRWRCLLSEKYLASWFSNLFDIGKLAQDNNFLLFTLDYPALVNINDSVLERNIILRNEKFQSRLNVNFADYQAISKQGISHFLEDLSPFIPTLNGCVNFNKLSVEERIRLFGDEVHFSTEGCKFFGQEIAELLAAHPDFISRFADISNRSNIITKKYDKNEIEETLLKSKKYLHSMINRKILNLNSLEVKSIDANEIPDERYTTF